MNSDGITGATTVVASADQLSRDVGDETVILGMRETMYYGLNPVGARVWSLIQEPRRVDEICETILSEYDVDPEQCERDVHELLTQLADEKLIDVRA